MDNVAYVSLGPPNRQIANAPEGSRPQHDIIIHMRDGTQKSTGSGWVILMEQGPERTTWYHLGGIRGKRQPVIYKLNLDNKGCWTKYVDQSMAHSLYEIHGR